LFYLTVRLGYRDWPGRAYDTDLYHANVVRWLNEYGVVPGLANLHMRFASNSSLFSIAAVMDNSLWDDLAPWIMPGIMLWGCLLYLLHEICFSAAADFRVYSLVVFVWLALAIRSVYPGLYYDDPTHVINAVTILEAYKMLKSPNEYIDKHSRLVMILATASFMMKPITSVSLLFCALLSAYLLIKTYGRSLTQWFGTFSIPFLAGCVWLARNAVLSGYPLFPLPIIPLPFDWTMTLDHAKFNYYTIVGWARIPTENFLKAAQNGFSFWIYQWLTNNLRHKDSWYLGIFPFMVSTLLWINALIRKHVKHVEVFCLFSYLSIIYWFTSAPDVRFGGGLFWVSLALSAVYSLNHVLDPARLINNRKPMLKVLVVLSLFIFGGAIFKVMPGDHGLFSVNRMPSYPMDEFVTDTMPPFTILIPQNGEYRCGNSRIPSSANFPRGVISDVEMRVPGNIAAGYRPRRITTYYLFE
jgi:hypothetical protein